MEYVIDRVRLSSAAKQQLVTLKRRTGIEHYNVLCRHALCASLANASPVPDESHQYAGGVEIEWRVFAGEAEDTYLNLLITRCIQDEGSASADGVKRTLTRHLHRGLSYLTSRADSLMQPDAMIGVPVQAEA
jgi:DNA sulfur modification protein DndE